MLDLWHTDSLAICNSISPLYRHAHEKYAHLGLQYLGAQFHPTTVYKTTLYQVLTLCSIVVWKLLIILE